MDRLYTSLRCMLSAVVLTACMSVSLRAQDEPVYDELVAAFKKKYLSVGILFQGVADFQLERSFPGKNGFNISNARVILSGELDSGFGYHLKANLIKSPSLLDAKMSYAISPQWIVDVGLFKPPFSKEYLTGAGAIDFVNRSQVVTALAGRRQIGLQVRGKTSDAIVSYGIGMFNGNGFNGNVNDNNAFLYVGRFAIMPHLAGGADQENRLEIGVNGAYSNDSNAPIGGGDLPAFDGKRLVYGGDVQWTRGRVLLSGEVLGARLARRGGDTRTPFGYHCTAGYMVTTNSQLLLRYESFRADGLASDGRLLVVGYNLWPTKVTELQVNYVVPTADGALKHHQLLVNAQLEF